MIEIWQPRWKDKTVLLAAYKVKGDVTEVIFTKTPSLANKVFKVKSGVVKQCPLESNGKLMCYAVPLDMIIGNDNPV